MSSAIYELLSLFGHRTCKEKINSLIQLGLDDSKKIHSLNAQIMILINQVQELKAVYDYQSFKFEATITELREKLKSRKPRCRTTPKRFKKNKTPLQIEKQ